MAALQLNRAFHIRDSNALDKSPNSQQNSLGCKNPVRSRVRASKYAVILSVMNTKQSIDVCFTPIKEIRSIIIENVDSEIHFRVSNCKGIFELLALSSVSIATSSVRL